MPAVYPGGGEHFRHPSLGDRDVYRPVYHSDETTVAGLWLFFSFHPPQWALAALLAGGLVALGWQVNTAGAATRSLFPPRAAAGRLSYDPWAATGPASGRICPPSIFRSRSARWK